MANPQANVQYETNKLPGFKQEPFDGKPIYFFDLVWFIPFIVACGNIQQDGFTLHQTFYGHDLGGANNPVNANVAQNAQHNLRVHRLYNVLMHYLKPNTTLYRLLSRPEWVSKGIHACQYVRRKGNKPLSEDFKSELETEWSNMTVESLNLDIDGNTLFEFLEQVEKLANKLGKTKLQIYTKFLQGLPSQMSSLAASEKMNPNVNFEYPANVDDTHPDFDENVPVAHPFAGQKDSELLCTTFTHAWEAMIASGAVRERKGKPSRQVNLVGKNGRRPPWAKGGNGGNNSAKPKREMDSKTCCYKCGGLGHVAKMQMSDGSVRECATQIKIEQEMLDGIQYPHIPSAKERREAYKNRKNGKVNEVQEGEPEKEPEPEPTEEIDSEDEEAQYADMLEQE